MELKTQTPISEALRQGYQGKAVEMLPEYPHSSILERMRAEIGQRLKLVSGPLYWGEAETTLLLPLLQATRFAQVSHKGQAYVPREAYQLAAAYALIFDISKISQSKDIAKEVTVSSVQVQPIVKAFMDRMNGGAGKADDPAMRQIWSKIDAVLKNGLVIDDLVNVNKSTISPLALLSEATSPSMIGDSITGNVVNVWNAMLANLRHGKGIPLGREDRKAYMATITELLMRIDGMIDRARTELSYYKAGITESERGDAAAEAQAPGTAFVDAYTSMYWLNVYLNAIAEYDVIFPQSDLMVQSQAWVLTIKTQAAKLKKSFMDIAQVAMSYDIFTAIHYWEEVRAFYDPILNQSVSAVADMTSLWSEMKARAEKLLSSYAREQADQMFNNFKAYMEAEFVLPEADFAIASKILSALELPTPEDGKYFVQAGPSNVEQLFTTGERVLTVSDRAMLIPQLSEAASAVEDAVAYAKRAREILQLAEETDDIYHALLPSGVTWKNPYALEGNIRDLRVVDFDRHDPMQVMYEKYQVSTVQGAPGAPAVIGALEWKFTDLLMRPFYKIPQLQEFADKRTDESRILWPGIGDLPVGDIITAQYVTQPVPACYTASRNANFVSNDMTSYLTLMSGHSGVTAASRDYFRTIASMLDKFPGTYERGILDALAAVMFVWKKPAGGSDWKVMRPSCPTIYGLPLDAMLEANKVKPAGLRSEGGLRNRSFTITVESGATYQFVLHAKMPKPEEFTYFAYPYAKGVYLHIPLLKSIAEEATKTIESALKISFSKDDNVDRHIDSDTDSLVEAITHLSVKDLDKRTIPVLGWAPFLINMPHLLCSYQERPAILMSAEYQKYAMLSVRVRYDSVERSIYVGGFIDNPVELFDMTEYREHVSEQDPTPIQGDKLTSAPDVEPAANEPNRSAAEEKPDPSTLGHKDPVSTTQALENAGRVTQAPVISGDQVKVPDAPIVSEENKKTTNAVDSEVLAGDPANGASSSAKEHEEGTAERYWKKISASGEIEEVIKAVACPDGYVPASEEEYSKWLVQRAKKDDQEEKGDQ